MREMVAELRQLDRRTARSLRAIEGRAHRTEELVYAGRMRVLGTRVHLAVVADRPDIADHAAGQIVSLSDRRLAQLSGDAA